MATYTPNYNLGKPEPTDPFGYNSFLPLFNDNMDKIDQIGGGDVTDVTVNGTSVVDPNTKIAEVEVPTKVSDLTNDTGFITSTVANLVNYYTKSQTYTQAEVDALISAIVTLNILVVQTLPTTNISRTTIYLVPKSTPDTQDVYDEYINLDGTTSGWEHIGSTQIDLSNYYTKSQVDTLLASKANTADLAEVATSGSYNDLSNKPTIPTQLSQLSTDSTHRVVTDTEKSTWNSKLSDNPTFTEASTRANIASGESFATILGKIKKFFTDLKTVAFTGSYNDLTNKPTIPSAQVNSDWNATSGVAQILNKPTIPTVNNATLTIQKNGTTVKTFTANASTNVTANITVPTKVSDLTNDSGYVTTDTKNTAGSTDTSSKIFLVGATSQAANPQTYSHDTAYVGTDGCLYSGGTKVLTAHQDISGKVNKSGDTMTGNLIIQRTGTNEQNYPATLTLRAVDSTNSVTSNGEISAYDGGVSGANMVINPRGNLFVGSGEAPSNHYALYKHSTTEVLYITSDNQVHIQAYGQTIANRLGLMIDNSGNILPDKADVATNNSGSIGTSNYKWANGYFTNINGVAVGDSPKFTDTNNSVTQTNTTGNANYRVLLSNNANDTTETTTARKSTDLIFNPSTGLLKSKSGSYSHNFNQGGGTSGYFRFLRITITNTNADSPIVLSIAHRKRTEAIYTIRFAGGNTTDPNMDICCYRGADLPFYYIKADTSTWDFYVQKTEAYDNCTVSMINPAQVVRGSMTLTWVNETVTALPTGYSTAVIENQVLNITGNADTATTARKVVNSTVRPATADNLYGDGGLRYYLATNTMTESSPPVGGSIIHMPWDSTNGYEKQFFVSHSGGTATKAYLRSQSAGTWGSWIPMAVFNQTTPTSGQVVITEGTNGGVKSSGFTIAKSVPSDAKFTDTTYTAGSNITLSGTEFSLTKANVTGALGYTPPTTDTKNTAGSTNTSSKIFLIGATSQAANPQTYSHDTAYVGTDGCLYSGGTKVLTAHQSIAGKVDKKTTLDTYYGTCSTAAATAAKVITVTDDATNFSLRAGITIVVKFSVTNTAQNPTFNVNSTGAKSVWYNTALITNSSLGYAGTADRPMQFTYDGTQWIFVGWSFDANTNNAVTQASTTTASVEYRILFSATADDTTRTEGARKAPDLRYKPSDKTLIASNALFTGDIKFNNDGSSITGTGAANNATTFVKGSAFLNLCSPGIQCRNFADTAWAGITGTSFTPQNNSSRKLKENIKPITEEEAQKLLEVNVVSFDYKQGVGFGDGDERKGKFGVIAEEINEIIPSVVSYQINADHTIDYNIPSGVSYDKFVPYLIKMIQMQQKEIDDLKVQIDDLNRRIK